MPDQRCSIKCEELPLLQKADKEFNHIDTPFLMIDKNKFISNILCVKQTLASHKVHFRPHLKTLKSVSGVSHLLENKDSPATVSTLREAEVFADSGYTNLTYAVGITPQKLSRVKAMRDKGVDMTILLDSKEQANSVVAFCLEHACDLPTFIEIDCDDHRAGIEPHSPLLLAVAEILHKGEVSIRGVLTHAGGSYDCSTSTCLEKAAEEERLAAVDASKALTNSGFPCPVISIGSTPTALSYKKLDGITEVRAGVFPFFDLVMAGIGVCHTEDIALSVATTVIGHNTKKNWLFIDAGWMALSRDRGTSSQAKDCGYGLVCDIDGSLVEGLHVNGVNQEHGIIVTDTSLDLSSIPIGTKLRILPNHACATAGMHGGYQVYDKQAETLEYWPRIQGW
jgi:D-serine deaminase-like pyridoxal phosphate-dependent protein